MSHLNQKRVAVVGAGPVGLSYAWAIKNLNHDIDVIVYEKYSEYQRTHNLRMNPKTLESLLEVTQIRDTGLNNLLKRLKRNNVIRTNHLQKEFEVAAKNNGVKIYNKEITKENLNEILLDEKNPFDLIIGADSTHSLISNELFSSDNQIKYSFDYVLQLRYEIKGEQRPTNLSGLNFKQHMIYHGITGDEHIGEYDPVTQSTPVTTQIMISKAVFQKLSLAKSKKPIKPFQEKDANQEVCYKDIPNPYKDFLDEYINNTQNLLCDQNLEISNVTVSTNEAPATKAKDIVKKKGNTYVYLSGDAALGLSYFKGLNAGLEAAAKYFSYFNPIFKNGFDNQAEVQQGFDNFKNWFSVYQMKKVKEVENYSTYRVRMAQRIFGLLNQIKSAIHEEYIVDEYPNLKNYFALKEEDPNFKLTQHHSIIYPHREYDPIRLGQNRNTPAAYTANKTAKIFRDYVKPYKSVAQVKDDFKQPIIGFVNLNVGLFKSFTGLISRDKTRFGDGLANVGRGIIEIISTPLTWFIKPILRGIATLIAGKPKIEENAGLKNLVKLGLSKDYLAQDTFGLNKLNNKNIYEIFGICSDIHRKFVKDSKKEQQTKLKAKEDNAYQNLLDKQANPVSYLNYLNLFKEDQEINIIQTKNKNSSQSIICHHERCQN